ncbi:putative acyl-CoA dehydrogenase FadE [Actinomadura sp. NBRC 104412]|uniref:acyl-CoA dehydrogenase family protein n=1 Tax=Actinomadura sp. NBRC 104412 TaxID=3032203 RepID=UPI0024A4EF0B|nr:acyl-CoA dehydrogenase family protein [Actinomadura sp. NBRC 104412]GLZ04470.1 putative acyl-CoA dehydrogenase FadE [Actinomadura sp. NBRC 104412]
MRFSFTADQRLLAETVREVLGKTCPPEAVRASATGDRPGPAWRALAEVGLLGAHIAEEHGGLGLSPVDTVLAYEETGWFAAPGPLVETAVAAPVLLRDDGTARLEEIAGGTLVVSARPADAPAFPDADLAGLLLVAGPEEEASIIERPVLARHGSVDETRPLFTAAVPGPTRSARGRAAFDHAALATAAQLLGLGRRLREDAVGYARQRRQFGKVIGSFQAVKHLLADVAVGLEFAAPLVYRAAYSLSHDAPTASRDVSMAKNAASQAAHRAARTALQVHGAIGYTDELDLHLWLNRVWALRAAWGDEGFHRARLRAALFNEARPARMP